MYFSFCTHFLFFVLWSDEAFQGPVRSLYWLHDVWLAKGAGLSEINCEVRKDTDRRKSLSLVTAVGVIRPRRFQRRRARAKGGAFRPRLRPTECCRRAKIARR